MKQSLQVGTYGDGYIELLPAEDANRDEDSRIKWTTSLAAISRGKSESANPEKRYKSLMKEAEGGRPSRPFEFLPIAIDDGELIEICYGDQEKIDKVMRFSHYIDHTVYTNMRALLWAGVDYEDIPYTEKTEDFVAFRVKAPMFVWAQIVTHTQLSTESQSDRVAEETKYWIPDDLIEKLELLENDIDFANKIIEKVYHDTIELADDIASGNLATTYDGFVSYMINTASQNDVQLLLRAFGYPREIWSRAPYYFKMKEFVITGWLNDDFAWPHFLRERNAYADDGGPKNWTQPETASYAKAMRKLIEKHFGITKEDILEGK